MSKASQQFIEMAASLGLARQMGLPPNCAILLRHCSTCNSNHAHLSIETKDDQDRVWEAIICSGCGKRGAYCIT